MFELFSTREVATGLWIVILIAYVVARSNGKIPFRDFLKAACNKLFIISVLCLFVYAAVLVYWLSQFFFWNWLLIKDVIFWILFVATPICFKLATKRVNDFPFRKIVLENFTASAILEFFVGSFTFSFWTEMTVVPVFSFLVLLQNCDRNNPKYQSIHKVLDGISAIVGFLLLCFTIDVAIDVISTEGVVDVLVSFCIPVFFSIAYLPVVYFIALKAQYHDLFMRLLIRNKDGKTVMSKKKKQVWRTCGFSYHRIQKFRHAYFHDFIGKVCFGYDDDTFFCFVEMFRKGNGGK